jgi:uncharacterized protein YbaR (Trm112 family)/SAM-dependent methyltransferase
MAPQASLDPHDLIPPPTHNRVDPFVQRWVAGTNGRLYIPLINKLPRYPIGRWLGKPASRKEALLLDVGCGWGRWMVAAGQKGYCPVGIDIKIEPLQAALRVMRHHGLRGYVVAADLKQLPFRPGVFDYVYSYSVIQHVHREYAGQCVTECFRVLRTSGEALLEFPVSHGITNFRYGHRAEEDNCESWCVRYYSFKELRKLFQQTFGNYRLVVDCFFGIGVRAEDTDLLPWPYKCVVILSEALKLVSVIVPPVRWVSDSVFVRAQKSAADHTDVVAAPRLSSGDNLAILPLLQCPLTQTLLEHDKKGNRLISRAAGKAYPIIDEIPILIPSQAIDLSR